MRLNRNVLQMLVLTVIACAVAFFCAFDGRTKGDLCTVALVPEKGMTILSENPVQVKRGGSAAFEVRLEDDCLPDEADGLRYENGVLFVENVTYSQSVHYRPRRSCAITVREADQPYVQLTQGTAARTGETAELQITPPEHYTASRVFVNTDSYAVPNSGTVRFTVYDDSTVSLELTGEELEFSLEVDPAGRVVDFEEQEAYHYADTITLRADTGMPDVRFDGWSRGAYLSRGGDLITTDAQLSFPLQESTAVFANFTDLYTCTVTIDPNGSANAQPIEITGCGAGKAAYLPADTGVLQREGYALIGYNTLPDGSGKAYALASPVQVGREDITLYAQWLPETDEGRLTYYMKDGFAVVQGASADIGDTLVIPARIAGAQVRGIDNNAFAGSTAVRTAVIPLGVTHIGSGAFSGCTGLTTVFLPDTLTAMDDSAFTRCPSLQALRVLAGSDVQVYAETFDAGMVDRYARLKNTPGKRIILVAGSSGSFGLDSTLLAAHYPDYGIINFSGTYTFGMVPLMNYVMHNVHEGDVVIFAPEYYLGMYVTTRDPKLKNWMYLESDYNMLEALDLRTAKEVILDSFTGFLNERRKELAEPSLLSHGAYKRSAFNEYGDVTTRRRHKKDTEPFAPDPELISATCTETFGMAFARISEQGGTCLFSFPPIAAGNTVDTAAYEAFTRRVTEAFAGMPCTVISKAEDCLFPMELFYDNIYHMTNEGAKVRTEKLIADLDACGLVG